MKRGPLEVWHDGAPGVPVWSAERLSLGMLLCDVIDKAHRGGYDVQINYRGDHDRFRAVASLARPGDPGDPDRDAFVAETLHDVLAAARERLFELGYR